MSDGKMQKAMDVLQDIYNDLERLARALNDQERYLEEGDARVAKCHISDAMISVEYASLALERIEVKG